MRDRTLVIDTATPACSVALFENRQLLDHRYEEIGRGHAERLVPMIAELPTAGQAARIAVNRGPGSFTGIRIGLAVARSLALVWDSAIETYSTHALMAAMARKAMDEPRPITVAMQGGHGELFIQDFHPDGKESGSIVSVPVDEVADEYSATCYAGTAAKLLADKGNGTHVGPAYPDASCWPLLADTDKSSDFTPLYIRPPDAKRPN